MSAYWHERGNVDAHFHPSVSAGPLTAHDLDDVDFSSDFDVIERVTDADIHAPERPCASVPSSVSSAPVPASPQLPGSRSISQRMLRLLQRHRGKKGHAAAALRSPLAAGAIEQSADDAMEESRYSLVDHKTLRLSTDRMAEGDPLSSRSGTSCTDRLEARISQSFLTRRESQFGLLDLEDGQDASLLYSGRRTYPAESMTHMDYARRSNPDWSAHSAASQETKMMKVLEKERAARVFHAVQSNPTVAARVKKDTGVRFHFRRGTPIDKKDMLAERMGNLTLNSEQVRDELKTALVKAQSVKHVTDLEYTTLAVRLADIESLVDGMEKCVKTPPFSAFSANMLNEMKLLTQTTQQIRASGTTLILAHVGKHQNAEFTHALRRLVARAASVQKRISELLDAAYGVKC
ncbi:unnamed protein product [Hyaloperonospora brassicae]|uniref:Uncharacterized protein n=1 Tax=Hyaloperonospora brassicae TaxID=162125 RepID=A0AAV0USZ1_HYABA|nr:unnamed protein product [Hyaloperonospora brassicae]